MKKRKPSKHAFQKGNKGRPKGALGRVTKEAKAFCNELIDSPAYQEKLRRDFTRRRVDPGVEKMIWAYGKGKPVERVESGAPGDFSKLTDAELDAAILEEAEAIEEARRTKKPE